MMACGEVVSMDIHRRHLDDADSICEDGLCLTVFVACGIHFELGDFGPFGVVILEETHEHFNRLVSVEGNGRTDDASRVAVQYEGFQASKFWRKTVDRGVSTVLKENGVSFKR